MNLNSFSCKARYSLRGFTLVELLVVMAIIAVLVSMLFPTFYTVKEQGRMILCQGNLKGLHQAFMAYAQDHRGQIARNSSGGTQNYDGRLGGGWLNGNQNTGTNGIRGITSGLIYPYINNAKVFVCPTAALSPDSKGNVYVKSYELADYLGWPRTQTITFNGIINDETGSAVFARAETFTQVARPSQTGMLWEANDNCDDGSANYANTVSTRHNGKGNMCYVDGHIESVNTIGSQQAYESFYHQVSEATSSAGGS